ncbi:MULTISPECIES: SDR family NAD(P)-dependent oxidoreductase [Gordonia]|uniref:SDR family oxidoreductase n=1 Tax=Gordonia amicalis TaxID=89053 RepID=A0AAE4U0U6_9ACTN|nr:MULTISPECIES: SDR family NAD(P)-dependent oxidoreductase [Gordonia]ATD71079.1 3-alpha-hydroxysteroid dehydrogenase [Gordonia sp. 1D]KAF0969754.1 3-alpha-(or 20-beta)-hydroxysteroid dehydrogenase [Gordonia sp. YY1]MCZ0912956.1 SDR family oxidoreductase [Gordonia amicalis]MCZ4653439.1 SDR family oxidoreductase [Gordonia amicalis]MDJ0453188.1 SDR family oxidoreductase [Gordonia amicalis]
MAENHQPDTGVALITGGARGIGDATARALASAGMTVVIADILDGHSVAESIGPTAMFEYLDVTDANNWQAVLSRTEERAGALTALINNAGILDFGSIETFTSDQFHRILEVNLVGPYLGMHLAADQLRRSGSGVIVNVSSTAGLMGYPNLAGYVASKWGLRGLTKAASLDLSADGIRVCSVHPGPIRTPMTEGLGDELTMNQPIPRYGEADEVARMIRFIVTEATYSTGAEFVVDGGAVTGLAADLDLPEAAPSADGSLTRASR